MTGEERSRRPAPRAVPGTKARPAGAKAAEPTDELAAAAETDARAAALLAHPLWPRCAVHEDEPARIACDRCGVFHCARCARKVGERYLCRGCESRAYELDRDLAVEGHVQAIAHYNFLVAAGGVVAMLFATRHPLLATSPLGVPLALAAAFFFGTLPPWLGLNLRRRWPVARHLQILLAGGLAMGGAALFVASPVDALRIQGFMFADYNAAILWVLLNRSGRACFTPRYRDLVADSPRLRPQTSPLYLLFAVWALLSFAMLQRSGFVKVS